MLHTGMCSYLKKIHTSFFFFRSKEPLLITYCVVPENIHNPTTEAIGNTGGDEGMRGQR